MANRIQLIIEADDQASSKFKRLVVGLEKGLSSTEKETQKLNRSSTQLGNTFKWAGGILTTYFGYRTLKGLADGIFDAGVKTQRFDAGLKGALGTVDLANQHMAWLTKTADELGLQFETQVSAFQKLAAAARGTSLEGQKTRDIFEAVSEAATVMQLSNEQAEGALYAISQMISKGTVAAEELRGQLGERLPGAFQLAARAMGVTTQQLSKMLEQGEIIADDFLPKFAKQLHEELGGAAKDAADTVERNINRLSNAWFQIRTDAADIAFPQINDAIKGLLDTIERLQEDGSLTEWAEAVGNVMGTTVRAVDGAILAFNNLFNRGLQAEIDATREKIERVKEQIAEKGVWAEAADGSDLLVKSVGELKLELYYLEKQELSLVNQLSDSRMAQQDIGVAIQDTTNKINLQATAVGFSKEQVKEWKDNLKEWTETYNTYLADIGEEEQRPGEFGQLFGASSFFPSQEQLDTYREIYNENLEAIADDTAVHYDGLSAQGKAYLANLVRETNKANKDIEKADKQHQQVIQQLSLQTAQLQMQTGQLVAQTLIAISGEQHGALFYMARAFAVVQAIVNAWLGYTQALAHPPGPPTTIPVARWTLGTGLAAAALIAAQTFVGHAEGGWIKGGSGIRDDVYLGTTGQTAHYAMGGEFIVNKAAAQENSELLEDINAGRRVGGGGAVIHNYIRIELEGEALKEFTKTTMYQASKAGEPVIDSRGIRYR